MNLERPSRAGWQPLRDYRIDQYMLPKTIPSEEITKEEILGLSHLAANNFYMASKSFEDAFASSPTHAEKWAVKFIEMNQFKLAGHAFYMAGNSELKRLASLRPPKSISRNELSYFLNACALIRMNVLFDDVDVDSLEFFWKANVRDCDHEEFMSRVKVLGYISRNLDSDPDFCSDLLKFTLKLWPTDTCDEIVASEKIRTFLSEEGRPKNITPLVEKNILDLRYFLEKIEAHKSKGHEKGIIAKFLGFFV